MVVGREPKVGFARTHLLDFGMEGQYIFIWCYRGILGTIEKNSLGRGLLVLEIFSLVCKREGEL